ncbi:uncharacterized protein LOC133645751 isoform X2 [Entelurus aequoreus]|uniref:uncharacterized protein LOC133645751 isoform X2 n=1 Tax=Entelurus aequoreus TaxID=161455 RepID=UPI002B1D9230|nr:uncharacterized protein LOC133645751 isoform X2 [Entelurus aequoreus]
MYSYAFTSTCIKHAESYTSSYHLGAPFRVPFHLIKFIMNRDIAVVPSGWYDDRMVFWPSYKNTDRIERAALNEEQHEPNWPRFDVSVVRTCDNYKDALKIMQQYGKGCNTSDLQSEAENEELPEKRNRKPVHRLGDSDDSEEDPGNSDLTSLGLASQLHRQTPPSRRVPARVMSTCQLDSSTGDNFLAPHHGEGCIHMPSPAHALNMQRVTQVLTTLGHHSDNYKDALKIMQQYGKGCNTSDLQSEAENEELPEKRNRKPVHRLGDSDDSEEDPGNSDLTSLGLASQLHRQTPPSRRVPARVMGTCQLDSSTGDNFLAPHHGEGRIHMPSPAHALNMQRVTQGTEVPPRLPPPPSPAALNMWQTEEPGSCLAYRPTWRGERMADNISCSAPEVIHILSLLETIKHNQDQLIAKVL